MKTLACELWKYRALIRALVGRHVNARYRGSFFGFVWSFLNPLCLIAVYSLVFQYYIRFQDVEHYTLFLFAGLLPWIWFSSGLIESASSISAGGSLITKAMFPPEILPAVSVLTSLVNFLFAMPLLIGYMLLVGAHPGISLVVFPVVVLIEAVFLFGLGLVVSALNVYFRDVQHIVGNLLTLWFFLCPILYPVKNIPAAYQFSVYLNPVALFTLMYQQIFIDNLFPSLGLLLLSGAMSICAFIVGALVFNHYRDGFAELV